ncbi:MAG: PD-(D/E)XK nuclease family protein [Candidatus Riflebacteria bacterium]|nr:PD-(D/E)XK nuclease family protein [Candidatus Riflebacteria bacterium]
MGINKEVLAEVLNDLDFETIELSLKEPNIFKSLSIARTEIRHSAFLSYILDPNQSHGLDDLVLKKILREVFSDNKADGRNCFDVDYIDLQKAEIVREWKNIDILIRLPEDVIIIENKIDSKDHSNQLQRYKKIAEEHYPERKKHFIYLTPFGTEPIDKISLNNYVFYSYQSIVEILVKITKLYSDRIPNKILHMINDYVKIVNMEIIMNDELNEMALKLYKAHKEAFDFVFENRPDASSALYPIFEDILKSNGYVVGSKNKGYIRFTSDKLDKLIPKNGLGWPGKELFLFEIDYFWSNKSINIKAVIAPGNEGFAKKIIDAVKDSKLYKKPSGKKWLVFYMKKFSFDIEEMVSEDDGEIKNRLRSIIEKAFPEINELIGLIENISG